MQEKLYRWAVAKGLDMEEVEMGLEEASARFSRMQVSTRLMLAHVFVMFFNNKCYYVYIMCR